MPQTDDIKNRTFRSLLHVVKKTMSLMQLIPHHIGLLISGS